MARVTMRPLQSLTLTGSLLLFSLSGWAASPTNTSQATTIAYEKFTLPNGLTLIVHEDRKAPIVAVNVWYHVGSKNEVPGKSGFAHLFEHLMFNGSENYNKDYFKALGAMGATDLNGTTNRDRTNYFQNVPTNGLDRLLFLESDRMGHLLGAIDQAKLDEQRGVVQNEKRQGENQPYGQVFNEAVKVLFPANHPYTFPQGTVIGSMDDLNAAALKDVQEWFKSYYGPNNATLVLAGDIDAKTALEKVTKYFGDIPASPPVARVNAWVPRLENNVRKTMEDRVPQARFYRFFNVPEIGNPELIPLDMAAAVLARGKTSRLFKRLVYTEQLATEVGAFIQDGEIASVMVITATAKPGVSLAKIETVVDEELTKFFKEGPTADELTRTKTQVAASFLRGVERIGGFGGKSDVLAESFVYQGRADAYLDEQRDVQRATKSDLQLAAKKWLERGHLTFNVVPFGKFSTGAVAADRKQMPALTAAPTVSFPAVKRATLSNGLQVVLAQRSGLPIVNVSLRLANAGFSSDLASTAGLSSLAMDLLDEGTQTKDALQLGEALANLGAVLSTDAELDSANFTLNALGQKFEPSLALMAEVVLRPRLAANDFERVRQRRLAQISQEKVSPQSLTLRLMPKFMYPAGHPYSLPLSGSGSETSVAKLTLDDVRSWQAQRVRAEGSTVTVVGDIAMPALLASLEKSFGKMEKGAAPAVPLAAAPLAEKPQVYLVDRPGAQQSVIAVGHAVMPTNNADEVAMGAFNKIFGGDFNSRINMNLREDKHWSYGVRSLLVEAKGQRPFVISAPVQTDKTKESMAELAREMKEIVSNRAVNTDEFERVQADRVLQLPGRWETSAAVQSALGYIVTYGLADDYFQNYAESVRALKLQEADAIGKRTLRPASMVWVIAGDRAKIEAGIRQLNLGELRVVDADGTSVK